MHHNPEKTLWIDLDTSKEFGFIANVFYIASNKIILESRWPSVSTIQPVLFLSRHFTSAKKNYWPMELEIAGFVWVVKKVGHIIELSKCGVIIQTNHSAIIDIV